MKMLNTEQIIKALSTGEGLSAGADEENSYYKEAKEDFNPEMFLEWDFSLEDSPIKIVEQFGGEGLGDVVYIVAKYKDQFFRAQGYYSSWGGSDWSYANWVEVFPQQVTSTVYSLSR